MDLINLVRIGALIPNHETLVHGDRYMDQLFFGLWLIKATRALINLVRMAMPIPNHETLREFGVGNQK